MPLLLLPFFFFFNDTATTEIYTLSLHDALPISDCGGALGRCDRSAHRNDGGGRRSAARRAVRGARRRCDRRRAAPGRDCSRAAPRLAGLPARLERAPNFWYGRRRGNGRGREQAR